MASRLMKSLSSTETTKLTPEQQKKLKDIIAGYGNVKSFHQTLHSDMTIQTLSNIATRGSGASEYVSQIVQALEKRES